MPASVATHGLLLLYVISGSTYNSDHKGPLKTCWCLLGSFGIIQFINNSAYMSMSSGFLWPCCLLWLYLHGNRLFGDLSFESSCLFFPPTQNHVFHATVISTPSENLWTNRTQGHNIETDKVLRNQCDLTQFHFVALFLKIAYCYLRVPSWLFGLWFKPMVVEGTCFH